MEGKEPGYLFGMRGVYYLGSPLHGAPTTPSKKRKAGCIISPRRRKGGVFNADTSKFSHPPPPVGSVQAKGADSQTNRT